MTDSRGKRPNGLGSEHHVSPPGRLLRAAAPDRAAVLVAVTEAMTRCAAGRWAWQGPAAARDRWATETGPKDLDLWCAEDGAHAALEAISEVLDCARIAEAHDPRRLRHVSLAVETPHGAAVVDLTYGDLRVGAVLLAPAGEIEVDPVTHRFTGAAAVADLLVRPVLRGRLPEPARLAEAGATWAATDPARREEFRRRLGSQLGARVAEDIVAAAERGRPDPRLPRRARVRLLAYSLVPTVAPATWAQRRAVLPAGRSAGPLGLRVRGVVVALVGTDGAGKSTVADELRERLHRYGLCTAGAYFGMARGNLPGVGLARRLLGVAAVPGPTGTPGEPPPTATPGEPPPTGTPRGPWPADFAATGPGGTQLPTDRRRLRRAAAWFYAAEYLWRYLRTVAPARARRQVVIADRWVYDLRESPWPGSGAARLIERLLPDPDVLVLPDAPIELIHRRKPERSLAEQDAQQQRYRRLLAESPAGCAHVVVDTSGERADPLAELVAAVVQAAHGVRRERDRRTRGQQ